MKPWKTRIFVLVLSLITNLTICMQRRPNRPSANNEVLHENLMAEIKQKIAQQEDLNVAPSFDVPRVCTFMRLAVEHGFDDCVYLLLQHGVSPDSTDDSKNESYLHFAARANNCTILRMLITAGAQLDVKTSAGTPLAVAAVGGQVNAVCMLLAAGADPNIPDGMQRKTLMRVVTRVRHIPVDEQTRKSCLYALLFYGADLNAKNHIGLKASNIADVNCLQKCKTLLENYTKFKQRLFTLVSAEHKTEAQKHLALTAIRKLAQRFTIAVRDAQGNTPLHLAVMKSDPEMTRLLFSINPQCIRFKNSFGFTPVHLAANTSNFQVLQTFIPISSWDCASITRRW